jgi:hypothetical protein
MPGKYWPVSVTSTSGSARPNVALQLQAGLMNWGTTSSKRTAAKCVLPDSHAISAPAAMSSTTLWRGSRRLKIRYAAIIPNASTGSEPTVLNAFIPNGTRIPAIMPLAIPFGTCAITRSSDPDRPISSRMAPAVR